ncbi:hypothetical protein PIB30_042025 [Stylosanthes scabra]|uniref:Uncharacterized protein n=1 Tax=Stylosanthes scabra TaxID=79078 RepID=A0ABU6UFL2_9FABA|nr:hypothetical protein [Stylosanthes scabra]
MEVARLRGGGRTHLNEGYFGDFTFSGQCPSISQAQFDLYGGGTVEAQHTFSHLINFSLRVVLGDFWESSPFLSFSLIFSYLLFTSRNPIINQTLLLQLVLWILVLFK